jgi:hypothetical protein
MQTRMWAHGVAKSVLRPVPVFGFRYSVFGAGAYKKVRGAWGPRDASTKSPVSQAAVIRPRATTVRIILVPSNPLLISL